MATLCRPHDASGTAAAPGSPDSHLFSHLEARALHDHDKYAIVYRGQRVGYGELHRAALCLAGYLQQHFEVRRGDRVLLAMPACPQFAMAWYGVLRCDAVVVMVDPDTSSAALARCARSTGARVAIVAAGLQEVITPLLADASLRGCLVAACPDTADATAPAQAAVRPAGMHGLPDALAAGIGPVPMQACGPDPAVMACMLDGPGQPRVATLSHRAFAVMTSHASQARGREGPAAPWPADASPMALLNQAVMRGDTLELPAASRP
ncbi:AMP-binding protein [Cupriavidus necator]|uniref:AMP-binding protein n=1 Tax=Cupriavidus necator TaxID=106590 RepID=UPI0005B55C8D|nr:AMP-binding protein [Cupriavidus necator]